jgi:hypothetical protein
MKKHKIIQVSTPTGKNYFWEIYQKYLHDKSKEWEMIYYCPKCDMPWQKTIKNWEPTCKCKSDDTYGMSYQNPGGEDNTLPFEPILNPFLPVLNPFKKVSD